MGHARGWGVIVEGRIVAEAPECCVHSKGVAASSRAVLWAMLRAGVTHPAGARRSCQCGATPIGCWSRASSCRPSRTH